MGGYRGNCEDTSRFECEIVSSMQWSATLNRQSLDAQLTKLVVYLVLLQEEVKRYRRESGDSQIARDLIFVRRYGNELDDSRS